MIMIYVCILYVSTYATADELMARGERANDAKWQRWGHKAYKVERERTFVRIMDLIMRDSSLFVCLAIDLVWQVSNISIINCVCFLSIVREHFN